MNTPDIEEIITLEEIQNSNPEVKLGFLNYLERLRSNDIDEQRNKIEKKGKISSAFSLVFSAVSGALIAAVGAFIIRSYDPANIQNFKKPMQTESYVNMKTCFNLKKMQYQIDQINQDMISMTYATSNTAYQTKKLYEAQFPHKKRKTK